MLVEVWKSIRGNYRVILYIFRKDDVLLGGKMFYLKGNKRLIPKYRIFKVNNSNYIFISSLSISIQDGLWVFVREEET